MNRRFYLKIVKTFVSAVYLLLNLSVFSYICFIDLLLIKVLRASTLILIIPHKNTLKKGILQALSQVFKHRIWISHGINIPQYLIRIMVELCSRER